MTFSSFRNVIGVATRIECLAIEVDTSLGGVRVVRVLEEPKQRRGLPQQIRQPPEFVSRGVDQWAYELRSALAYDPARTTDGEWLREEFQRAVSIMHMLG